MPDDTQSTDNEFFNEAFSIISEEQRPLEGRIDDVVNEVEDTQVDARDVLIAYGATLRSDDPLDSNNRRVSTLITTAERYGINLSLEEIIDANINGDTGPKVATSVSSPDKDDAVNITDKSNHRTEETTTDNITFDIDFDDAEAIKNAAVNIYTNSDLSLQEKRDHLKGLLTQAGNHDVSIKPSDVRAAINEHRATGADTSTEDIKPSEVTPGTEDGTRPEPKPDEAKLSLVETSVSSTGIHAGETVRTTVTVENTGESVGLKDIRIRKNHEVVKKDSVTVEPDDTTTKTFEIRFDNGGQHLLQVNDEKPVSITVLTPAEVLVTDLSTPNTRVAPDETTTVTATLENTGDLIGKTELDLIVGEHLFENRDIRIDGNSTQEETFEFELERPGTYTVSVGNQELDLTALQPASVNVTDYRLSSTGLELGEQLTVNVDVENTGDLDGSIAVALYENDSTIETKSVEVSGTDTNTISFTTDFDRTGSHTITINNLEETDVTVLKPASAAVREFNLNETSLNPSETLGVNATLDNTGDLSDTQTLNISVNGEVIHTEDVEVSGNQTETVTIGPGADIDVDFSSVVDTPGEYSISINGLPPETVEVLEPADVNVRYYSLSNDDVVPGEEFEVNVEIENTGDVPGETEIEIFLDNELAQSRTVEVDGNSDKRGTFNQKLSDPGTYSIVVNSLEPSDLTVRGTGEFNIIDLTLETDPDTVHVGDSLTISLTAENQTSLNSEQTTTIYLGGIELASEVFNLPGNTEETFTMGAEVEQPGIYNLEVNDTVVTTLEVKPELPIVELTNEEYITPITRCIKQKDDGKRCSRDAEDDSVLCWQHEDELENIDPEDILVCQYTTPEGSQCDHDAEPGGILCSEHNPIEKNFKPEPIDSQTDADTDADDEDTDWDEPLGPEQETASEPNRDSNIDDTADQEPDEQSTTEQPEQHTDDKHDPVNDSESATDPGAEHKRTVPGADDTEGRFNQNTSTRTTVGFDFVLDNDEDLLPSDVDGAGMIVDDGEYIGIAEVQPRSWSIHTPEEKQQIINQYRTMFLGSLDFPAQIVCYPTEFDMSEHISALEKRTQSENIRDDESYLLNIGRQVYPNWLRQYISHSQMKQRNFYIIVRVKPEQLNRFRQSNGGAIDTVEQRAPAIARLLRKVVPGAGEENGTQDVTRKDCLVELHDRLQRLESALAPIGVSVDPITTRDKAMTVLYQYYNNEHPIVDNFDVATRSEHSPTMRIDEGDWPTDAMTDIHYEDYSSSGDDL